MEVVPLSALPAQSLNIILGGQNCTVRVYQQANTLFMDLAVDQTVIFTGAPCLNRVNVKLYAYWAFAGALVLVDMEGESDPVWSGLGTRYVLAYIPASEGLPRGVQQ